MDESVSNAWDDHVTAGLVESNLDLVVEIAKSYDDVANSNRIDLGFTLEELVLEGGTGLRLAAERFEPQNGIVFSTYAAWWIRQAILRGLFQVREFPIGRSASGPQARLEQFGTIPEFRGDVERLLLALFDQSERVFLSLLFGTSDLSGA